MALGVWLLVSCQRPPDATYLRGYEEARDILDAYRGRKEELARVAVILKGLLETDPQQPHAYVAMARLRLDGGPPVGDPNPGPDQLLDKALALDPDFCDAHVIKGRLYFIQDRLADALEVLDRAERLRCKSPWQFIHRAQVYIELQRYGEAATTLERVAVATPESDGSARAVYVRALASKIWLAFVRSDRDTMQKLSREELSLLDGDNAWVFGNVAWSLIDAGIFDEAISDAREALRRMQYSNAEHALGTALYGASLWTETHPRDRSASASSQQQWKEAQTLLDFKEAGATLWGSLANHDAEFRRALQARIREHGATAPDGRTKMRTD